MAAVRVDAFVCFVSTTYYIDISMGTFVFAALHHCLPHPTNIQTNILHLFIVYALALFRCIGQLCIYTMNLRTFEQKNKHSTLNSAIVQRFPIIHKKPQTINFSVHSFHVYRAIVLMPRTLCAIVRRPYDAE